MGALWDTLPQTGWQAGDTGQDLKLDVVDSPAGDPYFRWAEHTRWRSYVALGVPTIEDPPRPTEIFIVARGPHKDTLQQLLKKQDHPLRIAPIYGQALPDGRLARHFTARLDMRDAGWLKANPYGLHWKLALPQRSALAQAKASDAGESGLASQPSSLQQPNVVAAEITRATAQAYASKQKAGPPGGLLGLIDYGCPFLNTRFLDDQGRTRMVSLWDQGESAQRTGSARPGAGWPWEEPPLLKRGRGLDAQALDGLAQAAQGSRRLDETTIYRGIDHLIDTEDPRRRVRDFTHGGHLLDVLGGRLDPLTGQGDRAGRARLAFVHLPLPAALDSTGASLAPHLLDGVRHLMSLAEDAVPLVVSISYGGQAGPHDGTALIERALEELGRSRRNFAIVLAAGNARQAQAHARRAIGRERSALLRCGVSAGDSTDSFVEAWYERQQGAPAIQARARTPSGQWSPWVDAGREVTLRDSGQQQAVVALLRHDERVGNGRRSLVLLAMGPTTPRGVAEPTAEAGEWQIELRQQPADPEAAADAKPAADETVWVDAWIERDDPARGSPAQPPRFLNQIRDDDRNTLSSIASGGGVLRAGAFNQGSGQPVAGSACGERGSGLPEVLAASEMDEETPSILAAATRSGETMRMSGTSVAAPVLARRLFNALAQAAEANGPPLDHAAVRRLALCLAGADGHPADPALMLPLPDDGP